MYLQSYASHNKKTSKHSSHCTKDTCFFSQYFCGKMKFMNKMIDECSGARILSLKTLKKTQHLHFFYLTRGLILRCVFVPVPSSFAVKSFGLCGTRTKTRTKNALSSHIKVGRFARYHLRYFLRY